MYNPSMRKPLSPTEALVRAEAKRKRQVERICAVRKHKETLRCNGQVQCEICGWHAPEFLQEMLGRSCFAVNAHHVLPVACGGSDELDNLVLLCPNHHAIADLLSGRFNKGRGNKNNSFITDKAELIEMLRLIDDDPAAWQAQMEERFSREQGEITELLSKLLSSDDD
jgi:predicted restriction endonuclease